ncbi:MAG: hypothetical protein H7X76_03760 [Prolixibacteraceae bacterium]|nr:hypothetical protein [Burkholderiales bacterium]
MSAEFFVCFNDLDWYSKKENEIKETILNLPTFSTTKNNEFWLLGNEPREAKNQWVYDVRLIFISNCQILVELNAHPKSIEQDLSSFFTWLRSLTTITVEDEDGVPSNW